MTSNGERAKAGHKQNNKARRRSLPGKQSHGFQRFARTTARLAGRPGTFLLALLCIAAWAVLGPVFQFSDTWQLVINTATTIITFLMVFLIQNTQNRDSEAMQVKLDELIRATKGCHNAVLDIEELSEEELDRLKEGYERLAKEALEKVRSGKSDSDTPELAPDQRQAVGDKTP
jgi:low affinity Fe/Cu permease